MQEQMGGAKVGPPSRPTVMWCLHATALIFYPLPYVSKRSARHTSLNAGGLWFVEQVSK